MYFPYLRGRQFELIALREFALERGEKNNVFPIVEPVKKTFNSIKLAIPKFIVGGIPFAVVLNPQVGDLVGNSNVFGELKGILEECSWTPAFIVKDNIEEIRRAIEDNQLEDVMLICSKVVDSGSGKFIDFVSDHKIKYIVSEENKSLKRRLKNSGKNLVLLSDCFIPKNRNSDYLNAPAEKFTEEHLFFEEDGYYGFSDYTTVSSGFSEGGTTPYAVSIHLTYKKKNEEIWIRHFTSISNDDRANIQGKFAEAAKKAVEFVDKKDIQTYAVNELRKYYKDIKYPGLGMVKKISIKHHLELVNEML